MCLLTIKRHYCIKNINLVIAISRPTYCCYRSNILEHHNFSSYLLQFKSFKSMDSLKWYKGKWWPARGSAAIEVDQDLKVGSYRCPNFFLITDNLPSLQKNSVGTHCGIIHLWALFKQYCIKESNFLTRKIVRKKAINNRRDKPS